MLMTLDTFLSDSETQDYVEQLQAARWQDGLQSAGGLAALAKRNEQADSSCGIAQALANRLLGKLGHHATFVSACLPHQIYPPVFNRYQSEQSYGTHVDAPIMRIGGTNQILRSDVSMTLFLSPADSYDGGELVIEGEFGAQEIKLDAGDAVVYSSSSLHRVNPVSRGERLAAITWIQSLVPDVSARALLFDLDQSIQALTRSGTTAQSELLRLTSVYHNLMRRMAQV